MKPFFVAFLVALAAPAFCQTPTPVPNSTAHSQVAHNVPTAQIDVPTRILEFKPVESDSTLTISPVTTFPLHCTSDGALFLDMLNVEDLHKHTVISIRDKKTQTYSPTAIPDLHDIHVFDFFPSDSAVSFLVRASKEPPGAQGPGKSSSGILWNKYHNFIATFDRSGSYKG